MQNYFTPRRCDITNTVLIFNNMILYTLKIQLCKIYFQDPKEGMVSLILVEILIESLGYFSIFIHPLHILHHY